jgi:hypothetical protein
MAVVYTWVAAGLAVSSYCGAKTFLDLRAGRLLLGVCGGVCTLVTLAATGSMFLALWGGM